MFENVIEYRAGIEPDEIAISTPVGDASFATLNADINRMARRLQGMAAKGAHVVVQAANPGLHWVATLALVRLGCTTSSLPPVPERPEAELLDLLRPDLFITDKEVDARGGSTFRLAPDWVRETFAASAEPVTAHMFEPEDQVRIVLSSGTTGRPKKMAWTRSLFDARLLLSGFSNRAGRPRQHIAVGFDTETGFRAPIAAWAAGGAALYPEAGFRWSDYILRSRPTTITLVPSQLDALLRSLPPGFPLQPELRISLISGALPPGLAARAKAQLTPHAMVAYGSTEAGGIAAVRAERLERTPGVAGTVLPFADVQIVDDQDQPLPPGVSGRVRVRSPGTVHGYLDDEEQTRKSFKDGWFYPGDIGSLSAAKMLTIEGRESEVLYLGGARIAPDVIEAAALAFPGVRDAAAFSLEGPESGASAQPCVAVVKDGDLDLEALSRSLFTQFPQLAIQIAVLDAIARSDRGKIQRDKVRDQAVAAALAHQRAEVQTASCGAGTSPGSAG